jgi:diadenylate cyclase
MSFITIISNLRLQDLVDIVFLSVVAYYLYLWFRGTKAFKAIIGLIVLGVIFTAARAWGLFLTTWVFQIFWQVLIILLIILFQSEIRQVLERVNPLKAIGFNRISDPGEWIPAFASGIFLLASRRIGAIVIIERTERVEEHITGGRSLNVEPDSDILLSIFQKESPIHDGAIVIRNGQIHMVSCYLPLSSAEKIPGKWGTRHRAAIGLTESCDAWVVMVSEESGDVFVSRKGEMIKINNYQKLSDFVNEAVMPVAPPKESLKERLRRLFTVRWKIKAGCFALVCLLWVMLAGQQDFNVSIRLPVEIKNLPLDIDIIQPAKPEVKIEFRGLRKDVSILSERNVHLELDLSMARTGKRIFSITRDQILLPNDRVQVINIEPSRLEFEFTENSKIN